MRHFDQSKFYFTVLTTNGKVHYECFTAVEALSMAIQDGFTIIDINGPDIKADDINDFVVYGYKG